MQFFQECLLLLVIDLLNEHVDDDEVTPIWKIKQVQSRKLLEHYIRQKEENSKLGEALTKINEEVTKFQKK